MIPSSTQSSPRSASVVGDDRKRQSATTIADQGSWPNGGAVEDGAGGGAVDGGGNAAAIGLVAVTAAGRTAAAELAATWPGETRTYTGPVAEGLPRAFAECRAVVAFLATGAVVRLLAPHIRDKDGDPGVVCVDEARRFAVALLGGHAGGANELACRTATVLGCEPVLTTASDVSGAPALDELAATMGWRTEPGSRLSQVGAALLSGEPVDLVTDRTWPLPPLPANVASTAQPTPGRPAIVVTDRIAVPDDHVGSAVVYRPATLVVGVGASRGASAREILHLVEQALAAAGLSAMSVHCLATVDVKAREPGIVESADSLGVPLVTHPAEALARVAVPNPSEVVRAEVGTPSVAEAAALRTDPSCPRATLLVEKLKSPNATVAIARHAPRGRLALVGLGPGARDLLTPRAGAELRRSSVVVGLDQYVSQVRDLLRPGTRILTSGLGEEEERARSAAHEAVRGHAVALIGSGDAGVYAMASPALQEVPAQVEVVGVPGVTAALAAANLLGAPLGHDHAIVSLSDLHTPWEAIEKRVRAAAEADLVVAFYNPRSRARDWQLPAALRILAEQRPPRTPVGYVRAATRTGEKVTLSTLAQADLPEADMMTLVVVGSSATRVVAGRMVTPRGYTWSGGERDRPERSPAS